MQDLTIIPSILCFHTASSVVGIKYLSNFFSVRIFLNGHRSIMNGRRPSLCLSANSTFWWIFRHLFANFPPCHCHKKNSLTYVSYLGNTPILFFTVSDNNLTSLLVYGHDYDKFDDTQNQNNNKVYYKLH